MILSSRIHEGSSNCERRTRTIPFAAQYAASRPSADCASGDRQLSPCPPGLVHRARRRCESVGNCRVHRSSGRHGRCTSPQDGLYTLITRSPQGDDFELVGSLSAVHAAAEHDAYLNYLSRPDVAIVTITVTEAAYLRAPDGGLDVDRDVVQRDLQALREDSRSPVGSLPARLVAGLLARRSAGAAALTILSCDNLPENGAVTKTVVTDLARLVDDTLMSWIETNVDFAASMVDRITPGTTDEDRKLVEEACCLSCCH
jgi:hypothetical protein